MGIRVECDWCRQTIPAGAPYVTIEVDGLIVRGASGNEPESVARPARVYCGRDRYEESDPAARGMGIGGQQWGHRESCALRVLAVLDGNPVGRVDAGMEWRLVALAAPKAEHLVNGPISALGLTPRINTALETAGVEDIHELARMTELQWMALKGISQSSAKDILQALHRYNKTPAKARAKAAAS